MCKRGDGRRESNSIVDERGGKGTFDGAVKIAPMSTKDEEEGARTNGDDAAAVGGVERRRESDTLHLYFQ